MQYRDQTCFSMHKHLLDSEGCCWNPSLKGEGFNDPEGSSRCWCIRKTCLVVIFAYLKSLEKRFEKFIFVQNGQECVCVKYNSRASTARELPD